jgi:hypothetical protein
MSPRTGLDDMENRKLSFPYRVSSLYQLSYSMGLCCQCHMESDGRALDEFKIIWKGPWPITITIPEFARSD